MSYEEFPEWTDEDTLVGWVDGEAVKTMSASRQHRKVTDFLTITMRTFVGRRDWRVVLNVPCQMQVGQLGRKDDFNAFARFMGSKSEK